MFSGNFFLRMRFGFTARILFYETLRDFVREDVAVYEVIKRIELAANLFKVFPVKVLQMMMSSMRGSQRHQDASLGAAIRPWAPAMEASLISAGERMGRVDVALHEAVQLMKARQRVRGLLLAKLPYPIMLLLMVAAVLAGLSHFMVPLLEQMLDRGHWPATAKLIGFLADNSGSITTVLGVSMSVFSLIFVLSAPRWTGPVRDFFDRYIPPWSLYRELQGSMALMVISMLTASGVPMGAAFELLRENASPWVADHMSRIMMRMRSGKSEAYALAGNGGHGTMFNAYTAWQISLYSANASMASKLRSLSESSSQRVEGSISKFANIVKAVMMVLVATLLVLTYVSYMTVSSNAGNGMGGL
ncbi:type II secretion system F family protein [Paucibacter soli]|uniref:type II secretion system F family protein n=1 Tax=Paucibacter soli TaxID=3133433 RepID=UPI0030A072F1